MNRNRILDKYNKITQGLLLTFEFGQSHLVDLCLCFKGFVVEIFVIVEYVVFWFDGLLSDTGFSVRFGLTRSQTRLFVARVRTEKTHASQSAALARMTFKITVCEGMVKYTYRWVRY